VSRAGSDKRPGPQGSDDDLQITLDLLGRYDRPGPRYTSYPTAVEFTAEYTESDYRSRLAEANEQRDEPLSLYLHLPFCQERCTFCGCHVIITRKTHVAVGYLEYLHRELDMLAEMLPNRRKVSQYHWGGGTPTYLTVDQMRSLQDKVQEHFDIEPDAEAAIEVDPRVTDREQIDLLHEMGFNRISMGVQDFTDEVQAAVNRHQSEAETRDLHDYCRSKGFASINLDMIYGLPRQTPETFERSVAILLELRPDRVAVYSYAFVPWIRAHQKRAAEEALPSPEVKLRLFCIARKMLLDAGYVQIGMDHFALPEDELAQAVEQRTLHRNFMGYTVKMGSDMVGVGVSAIGDVRGSFAQNHKKLSTYYERLDAGRFPIERGYGLSEDDRIRREVILRLMCNFNVDTAELGTRFGIRFDEYFADELTRLTGPGGMVEQGFVEVTPNHLEVIGNGRLFVRNVCMEFDRYLASKNPEKPIFSRTV